MSQVSQIKVGSTTYNIRDDVHTWGGRNLATLGCMVAGYNGSSMTYDRTTNTYTITNGTTTSTWGSGLSFSSSPQIVIPYGVTYRVSCEVYSSAACTIQVDTNNYAVSGSSWSGNDNDLSSTRTGMNFSVAANTWTKLVWGSSNAHANNTNKVGIYLVDGVGYQNASGQTWKLRNPKVELGNKPTDWSPAPEDLAYVSGTELVLLS